ncbi:glycosyltransferase [Marinicrinis lubricantis]
MLVTHKDNVKDDNVIQLSSTLERFNEIEYSRFLDQALLNGIYLDRRDVIFSVGVEGADITQTDIYKESDIIHFHWINGGMIGLDSFSKIEKPIVWTFRDMWPFTGGCHYSGDCRRYEIGCGSCPQLNSSNPEDLTRLIMIQKKNQYKHNMTPVAISNWLKLSAENSEIFRNQRVEMIPNCIDTDIFRPYEKEEARDLLGIPKNKKIILLGSIRPMDNTKGFGKIKEAFTHLVDREQYHLVVFGKCDELEIQVLGCSYQLLGFINDDYKLALVYSSADVFVAPSIEEAFGKTLIEALSCQTPVVAFDANGPQDIVEHEQCGYLATPFEPADLARGIQWVLGNKWRLEELSKNARIRAVHRYSLEVVGEQYLNLYQHIIEKQAEGNTVCFWDDKRIVNNVTDIKEYSELQITVDECGKYILDGELSKGPQHSDTAKYYKECIQYMCQIALNSDKHIFSQLFRDMAVNVATSYKRTLPIDFLYFFDTVKLKAKLEEINKESRHVVIFGAGEYGAKILRVLEKHGINVRYFIDNNLSKWGQFFSGIEIIGPRDIDRNMYIFIASTWANEIRQQLIEIGMKQNDDFMVIM